MYYKQTLNLNLKKGVAVKITMYMILYVQQMLCKLITYKTKHNELIKDLSEKHINKKILQEKSKRLKMEAKTRYKENKYVLDDLKLFTFFLQDYKLL